MNDATLKSAIEHLPFSDAERRAILRLSERPSRTLLFTAVVSTVSGVAFLILGSHGIGYTFHAPAANEPMPAFQAFALARLVAYFFLGILQLFLAVLNTLKYYQSRQRRHIIELLVSSATTQVA